VRTLTTLVHSGLFYRVSDNWRNSRTALSLPRLRLCCFLVFMTGSQALALQLPWHWRLTLRSLFIATTFLAVVLGMIAWLDRA
jgi:hypothetical protein